MPYIVSAEEMEGNWIAHVPDLPGCFATHRDREAAISAVPSAVEGYTEWCRKHGLSISGLSSPMVVSEVVRAWFYEPEYEVNAFFASDRPPVSVDEIPEFERLLHATRKDLLGSVSDLNSEDLDREIPGERWPIHGVLLHIANAEWWYMDRMGLGSTSSELPDDAFQRLQRVREHFLSQLKALAGRTGVVTLSGETWAARKVLRRAIWHERDHTDHIAKLRRMIPRSG